MIAAPPPAGGDGRLADNVAYFARILRAAGLKIGPRSVLDAADALIASGSLAREDIYWTLHSVFVTRREDSAVFAQAFAAFWRRRQLIEKLIEIMSPSIRAPSSEDRKPGAGALRVADALGARQQVHEPRREDIEVSARLTASATERLKTKDFAQMDAAEIAQAKAAIARLTLAGDNRLSRRFSPDTRGTLPDMRRTMRDVVRQGGEMNILRWRRRVERPLPVVALVDISGSMSEYARVFLHFLHALTNSRRRVETFLFATRLTCITRELTRRDPDEALARVSARVPDWEGGTRIASALADFNKLWSRRVLGQGANVLLVTDGLEREPDEALAFQMDRLARSATRLIWLNPLLRYDGFEAKAAGIRTMMPLVDDFLPVHNVASVEALCHALGGGKAGGHFAGGRAAIR